MKKKLAALLIALGLTVSTVTPSQAQWGCWTCGGWGGYGYGYGGYGAALGIGVGAALLGGVVAGAIANGGGYGYGYGYAPYYAVPARPVYRYRYNAPVYYYDYYGY